MSYEVVKTVASSPGSALVTVVAVKGSVPRHVGSKMLVLPDLSTVGTVGGGLLESRALELAHRCLAERRSDRLEVELTGSEALGSTPVCGGVAELWIEYVADPAPFQAALKHLDAGGLVVLASRQGQDGPACVAVLDNAGGLLGGEAGCADPAAAVRSTRDRESRLDGDEGLFYDPVLPPERLFIFGGGHVGRAVARLATALEFKVSVIDERAEFADAARFPSEVETIQGSYAELIARLPFGPSTYALVVTPGHLSDLECVRAALKREYRYLGLIGSKRKVRMIMDQLLAEGEEGARVEALFSPVGIDIGAETPEEIAVSILAEMIALRRSSPTLASLEQDRRRRRF